MSKELKTVSTLATFVPGPVGAALTATIHFIELIEVIWGKDPIEQRLAMLQAEITAVASRLEALRLRVEAVIQRLGTLENKIRLDRHKDILLRIQALQNRLAQKPASANDRDAIAFEAWQQAELFLDEMDLWNWTDVEERHIFDDYDKETADSPQYALLAPDFKSHLALPLYALAVVTWLNAIDLDTGGNAFTVYQKHGSKLRRHIDMCRARPGYDDLRQEPATLAEHIMYRIMCRPLAQHKYALADQCLVGIVCENTMERRSFPVADVVQQMPQGQNVLCQVPEDLGDPYEQEIEDQQGVATLRVIADLLERVLTTGSPREQLVGLFAATPSKVLSVLYTIAQDGILEWRRQKPVVDPDSLIAWEGPNNVGDGWQMFAKVYPAGGNKFYAMTPDGVLHWYRHDGFNEGEYEWAAPKPVHSGWQQYTTIFAGSDGILYGIAPDGTLHWARHYGVEDGGDEATWARRRPVGGGWNRYKAAFSAGGGVIYGIEDDGRLMWWKHVGREDGDAHNWHGPEPVGSGWQNFKDVFCGPEGMIYALTIEGDLLRYEHLGWQQGTESWREPVVVAHNLAGHRQVFALVPATPRPVR